MSSASCANCSQELSGKYCSNCGQKAETHRLNWHFLWHDVQHGLFHFDKGVTFTIKELFTRPGYSIKEFLDGKRVNHFKPVSLVVLLGGVFAFLYHFCHIQFPPIGGAEGKKSLEILDWAFTHFSIMELINIPFTTAAATFVFRKYRVQFHRAFRDQHIYLGPAVNRVFTAISNTGCVQRYPNAIQLFFHCRHCQYCFPVLDVQTNIR